MKKPLRLIAALLAFCVLAATFPPVGMAADSLDLRDLINQAGSGGVVDLEGKTVVANDVPVEGKGLLAPFVISDPITIQNGTIAVRAGGIVLGANAVFSNVEFSFAALEGGTFIAANGYTLTLENVTCVQNSASFNLYCGSLTGYTHPSVSLPDPGGEGTIVINENVNIQGNLYSGNIYAGNVYRTRDGNGAPNKVFSGGATVSVLTPKNNLGAVYACGATQNGADAQADETYTVSGTVRVTGNAPDVYGTDSNAPEVIYRGGGNLDTKTFLDISSLSVESGELALTSGSRLSGSQSLSIAQDAKLNLASMTDVSNLEVQSFSGNGCLILGENQTLNLAGTVEGTTTVAIGSMRPSGNTWVSGSTPKAGQTYIQAPGSQDGNFVLLPPAGNPNITLERNDSGSWIAVQPVHEDSKLVSLALTDTQAGREETEIYIPVTQRCTGTELSLDTLPFIIEVNGEQADFNHDEGCYEAAGLQITAGFFDDAGDSLMVCNAADITAPVPGGTYGIKITVPGGHTSTGYPITASCTLTVGDPVPVSIDIPKANTGLKWTGAEQIGVNEGTGYTLSGVCKAADVGGYEAIAAPLDNYQWTGGSRDSQTIRWSIGRADGPAAPGNLAASAPNTENGADGQISGTTSEMEYASKEDFSDARPCGAGSTTGLAAGTYYVRVAGTTTHEPGAYTAITVPACGAPTVTGISVSSKNHKTEYKVGEPLDVTNLVIEVAYSNNTAKTLSVTENMVSGFDSSQASESQILTITHEGHTAAYTVRITASEEPGKPKYQVTLNNLGDGGSGGGSYEEGSTVTIRAGSRNGYTFSAWQQPEGVTLADRNSPETSFTMPGKAVTLLATWKLNGGTTPPSHSHSWSAAWKSNATHHWHDCTASGCTVADNSQKSGYAAHTAGDWVVDQPASSSRSGSRHRSCTVCGYEMVRETIPATGGSSSSGGSSSGGSSSSTAPTVKNPDGSTSATSTNRITGTVTETTRRPDGSKTVVETKKDGTVTTTDTAKDGSTVKTVARPDGTTETSVKQAGGLTASIQERPGSTTASIRLPSKAAEENPGGSVVLPIPPLSGENAAVTVHTGTARPVSVEIPVYGKDATTVACLVNGDGSETILKTALLTGGQITVSVSDGATVRIRDNGNNFQDTRGHWAKSAIDFVSARELFSGKTASTFAPDAPMSRAMLATVLARLDGVDAAGGTAYEKGMAWAVNQGISDGRNPDSQVTREQFVTMLHRYVGSPAATDQELRFSDAEAVGAYAREAMRWAMENGILSGYGDGSCAPKSKATRAQAAAMLVRYVKYLNQQ